MSRGGFQSKLENREDVPPVPRVDVQHAIPAITQATGGGPSNSEQQLGSSTRTSASNVPVQHTVAVSMDVSQDPPGQGNVGSPSHSPGSDRGVSPMSTAVTETPSEDSVSANTNSSSSNSVYNGIDLSAPSPDTVFGRHALQVISLGTEYTSRGVGTESPVPQTELRTTVPPTSVPLSSSPSPLPPQYATAVVQTDPSLTSHATTPLHSTAVQVDGYKGMTKDVFPQRRVRLASLPSSFAPRSRSPPPRYVAEVPRRPAPLPALPSYMASRTPVVYDAPASPIPRPPSSPLVTTHAPSASETGSQKIYPSPQRIQRSHTDPPLLVHDWESQLRARFGIFEPRQNMASTQVRRWASEDAAMTESPTAAEQEADEHPSRSHDRHRRKVSAADSIGSLTTQSSAATTGTWRSTGGFSIATDITIPESDAEHSPTERKRVIPDFE